MRGLTVLELEDVRAGLVLKDRVGAPARALTLTGDVRADELHEKEEVLRVRLRCGKTVQQFRLVDELSLPSLYHNPLLTPYRTMIIRPHVR